MFQILMKTSKSPSFSWLINQGVNKPWEMTCYSPNWIWFPNFDCTTLGNWSTTFWETEITPTNAINCLLALFYIICAAPAKCSLTVIIHHLLPYAHWHFVLAENYYIKFHLTEANQFFFFFFFFDKFYFFFK